MPCPLCPITPPPAYLLRRKVYEISVKNGIFPGTQDRAASVDIKAAATLDFYVAALRWALDLKFPADQLSTFYSIVHVLFNNIKGSRAVHRCVRV